ncbi:DUF6193 family natural product biosynthesis protein [Streptomyces sp. NPDC047928]|uniref:DUF6193 family natural product biosynthesis protein n=1 Tax=unclassified Streptomyces TaxID=2593676 RepID=UPI0037120771
MPGRACHGTGGPDRRPDRRSDRRQSHHRRPHRPQTPCRRSPHRRSHCRHGRERLRRGPGDRLTEAPTGVARLDGRFEVKADRWGDVIGETDSAEEAVALIVAHLPERLDAAGTGTDGPTGPHRAAHHP